ncbi:MAG: hypothetical protein SNJ55_03820 [Chloroherpetonaceae bacterium]
MRNSSVALPRLTLHIAILFFSLTSASAQSLDRARVSDTLSVQKTLSGETVLKLRTTFIDSLKLPDGSLYRGTVKIFFDNLQLDSTRFRIDHQNGIIYLRYLFLDEQPHTIEVRYRTLPFQFKSEYARRELIAPMDSLTLDTAVQVVTTAKRAPVDDIFEGTKLRKSGSIVRGVTVGSNQDLNVNSGFRLQLEGELADGVEVSAALTDENTPIQPEGNTQTIQEFDRVFVEVRSKNATATLGDFNLDLVGTEFANLSRRLQGGKVEGRYDFGAVNTEALLGFAVSRGRFAINNFNGLDGVQGPYRLTSPEGRAFIVVLAGSERVYVDGVLQTRGQNNDYIIEYGTGEIFFQPRRLITAQSRIVVDFQFTERIFPRNFLASKIKTDWFGGKLSLQTSYLSESDDENAPIDFNLTEEQRRIIAQAGANRFLANDTSAFVGVSDLGVPRGSYVRVDTVVNGQPIQIFRFVGQGVSGAVWSPSFSLVGEGQGSYRRVSFGIFEFVGEGQGNYVPFRLLPIPTAQNLIDFGMKASPFESLLLEAEGAVSDNDLNKLSILDDEFRRGTAYKFGFNFAPKSLMLFGKNYGRLELNASQRFTDAQFAFIDRTLPVEFERDFNLIDFDGRRLFTAQTSERLRNATILYAPISAMQLRYGFGDAQRDTLFSSTRQTLDVQARKDSLGRISYNAAYTQSRNAQTNERAKWLRQQAQIELQFFPTTSLTLIPFFNFERSAKETRSISADTLRPDSHNILDLTSGFRLPTFFGQAATISLGYRTDQLFDSRFFGDAQLIPASIARTLMLDWRLLPLEEWFAQLNFTNRLRTFSERFKEKGNLDAETFLLRFQVRYTPFRAAIEAEWLYDVQTEKAARTERQFFVVPNGAGNYIWRDRNGNRLKEFDEFIPLAFVGDVGDDTLQYILRTFPSDELFPTIDLRTSFRLRMRPSRIIREKTTFARSTLAALSSETLLRVEERSTETDLRSIYLLNFSKFLNDQTTLVGNFTVQQDVFLFENEITNVRFRFQQRTSQNQFSLGVEKRLFAERSMRFVTRIGYELGFELNLISAYNRSRAAGLEGTSFVETGRQFEINSVSVSPDISYRPFQDLEFGVRALFEQRVDERPAQTLGGVSAKADINSQQLRSTYSFRGKGRLNAQIERLQTTLRDADFFNAVFELTGGNAIGTSVIWRIDADYRISNYITASGGYDGRALPIGRTIHTARAEVRAVF